MGSRVVVKFGGADLSTGEKVLRAAKMIIEAPYSEKVVVVSAMGKTTDELLETMSQANISNDEDYAEIISMGERTSARFFRAALRKLRANAELFDPQNPNWPLITDSDFRNAKPDVEKTTEMVRTHLEPILANTVAIVCGFLGKNEIGKTTCLGRGGSDTTALLLAKALNADEAILVKETSGVLSADPKIIPDARKLDDINIHEMFDLTHGGAKIVKPEALRYKLPSQKLRVVDFSSGNISTGGTEITGSFDLNSAKIKSQTNLLAINVVCDVNAENLKEVFSALSPKQIFGVSSGRQSITVLTTDGDVAQVITKLHSVKSFKAVSHRENVAMLQISHPTFVDSPGGVAAISTALSQESINIIEVTTSKATINVFIEEMQLNKAKEVISHVFTS